MKRFTYFLIASLFGASMALSGCAGWNDQGVEDEEFGVSPAYEEDEMLEEDEGLIEEEEGMFQDEEGLIQENGGVMEEGGGVVE